MAEVQTNTQSGEMTQRFIEFVMMQAQNAAIFLGQIPHPQTGQPEVNLEAARMFIDQLAMVEEKTRGNLTNEETKVLRNTLSSLQMAFVEASQGQPPSDQPAAPPSPAPESSASEEAQTSTDALPPSEPGGDGNESRKKFSKSYGA